MSAEDTSGLRSYEERVSDFLETVSGMSFIREYAEKLYKANETEKLSLFMAVTESQLAIDEMRARDALPYTDPAEKIQDILPEDTPF